MRASCASGAWAREKPRYWRWRESSSSEAILDDAAARACAKAFGIPVIGTLGVIVRAKRRGLVPTAADVLKAVRAAGLHLDDQTIRLVLGRIGEAWPAGG